MAKGEKPANLYSDNATTFVGAHNELRKLFLSAHHQEELNTCLAQDGISWKFISPRAPHFGGLWEAAVKSLKFHLTRVTGHGVFTYKEMYTFPVSYTHLDVYKRQDIFKNT